jgi:hypothetical protein
MLNNNEIHQLVKLVLRKLTFCVWVPCTCCFPEDTTCAVLFREMVCINYWNLIKIIRVFGEISILFCGPYETSFCMELECSYSLGNDFVLTITIVSHLYYIWVSNTFYPILELAFNVYFQSSVMLIFVLILMLSNEDCIVRVYLIWNLYFLVSDTKNEGFTAYLVDVELLVCWNSAVTFLKLPYNTIMMIERMTSWDS